MTQKEKKAAEIAETIKRRQEYLDGNAPPGMGGPEPSEPAEPAEPTEPGEGTGGGGEPGEGTGEEEKTEEEPASPIE